MKNNSAFITNHSEFGKAAWRVKKEIVKQYEEVRNEQ